MNGLEVNYPCSPVCALFGDCVTAFELQKKANVRTNADRIRAMTDEEIAEWVCENGAIKTPCDIICGGDCNAVATLKKSGDAACKEIVMKWLQQPAEEDYYETNL